jgi:hypothetical protein
VRRTTEAEHCAEVPSEMDRFVVGRPEIEPQERPRVDVLPQGHGGRLAVPGRRLDLDDRMVIREQPVDQLVPADSPSAKVRPIGEEGTAAPSEGRRRSCRGRIPIQAIAASLEAEALSRRLR